MVSIDGGGNIWGEGIKMKAWGISCGGAGVWAWPHPPQEPWGRVECRFKLQVSLLEKSMWLDGAIAPWPVCVPV